MAVVKSDSYKFSHSRQEPPGLTEKHYYLAARKARIETPLLWFGLQSKLLDLADEYLYMHPSAQEDMHEHFLGTDVWSRADWEHLTKEHRAWPVRIHALPEGTLVYSPSPLMTVENTCPQCYWVPGFLEPYLEQVWYPSTVASKALLTRYAFEQAELLTGTEGTAPYKLHDFGLRGASSMESAAIGGAAHLVVFRGTDNTAGLDFARTVYQPAEGATIPGVSVPAMEHSTVMSWGEQFELDAFEHMLDTYQHTPISIVIDTYDTMEAIDSIAAHLHHQIMTREPGCPVVFRPDSGNPLIMVPEVISRLAHHFGEYTNGKGYRVLDEHVRVIQGDGMTHESIVELIETLAKYKWSIDNLAAVGMGGGLLQRVTREDYGFTMKLSNVVVNGEEREVYKRTPGKESRPGRQNAGMPLVYENGHVYKTYSLEEVRATAGLE